MIKKPFIIDDQRFKSLSPGTTAADDSSVNCDGAGPVWVNILESIRRRFNWRSKNQMERPNPFP